MQVVEGNTYKVRYSITNKSVISGSPIADTFTIAINGYAGSIDLIPVGGLFIWNAKPGETKTGELSFILPPGTAGKDAAIQLVISSPEGKLLGEANEPLIIIGEATILMNYIDPHTGQVGVVNMSRKTFAYLAMIDNANTITEMHAVWQSIHEAYQAEGILTFPEYIALMAKWTSRWGSQFGE